MAVWVAFYKSSQQGALDSYLNTMDYSVVKVNEAAKSIVLIKNNISHNYVECLHLAHVWYNHVTLFYYLGAYTYSKKFLNTLTIFVISLY